MGHGKGKLKDEDVKEDSYPHVVIRYMAAVYDRRRVVFVENETIKPHDPDTIVAICSEPYVNGKITTEARKALIAAVRKLSLKASFKLCLVFGKEDGIYFDQGTVKSSSEPPEGGVSCIRFPI